MATVTKRISHKTNQITYQVKIRMKGFPPVTETFKGKTEADKWAKLTEAKMIEGKHFPHAQAKKHTLSELIDAYLNSLKAANARRFIDVKPKLDWWKAQLGYVVLAHLTTEQVIAAQNKLFTQPSGRVDEDGKTSS